MRGLLERSRPALLLGVTLVAVTAAVAHAEGIVAVDPEFSSVNPAGHATVAIMYDANGATVGMRGYHLVVSFDHELILIDNPGVDVREGDLLKDVGSTLFFVEQPDAHTVVIDCAILGSTGGATTSGDLCSITFLGQETEPGVSPVHFSDSALRDPVNDPIEHSTLDGEITLTSSGVTMTEWSSIKALYR